ncbi:MAG: orc1/cdc6 family replication initiation protein [Candidatus Pacearchaeota archaeon]|nr:orc1/cdc6 family replication initiation protein [Candidatus Pacearchaeota archaeon]
MGAELNRIFDAVAKNSIFTNKFVLQTSYTPENIPYRDKQIEQVASILAPALRGDRPSNLFIYGQTGTGKTLSAYYIRDELMKRAKDQSLPLRIEYLNCKLKKVADTEYRILAELIKKLGGEVPSTGLPTDQVYNKFIELVEKEKKLLIIIFDEIDQAVKKISDEFLYNLTRLNSELSQSQISLIGISNDLKFLDSLDPRVRSSLGEEELVFSPYNAVQLQEILRERSTHAFKEAVLEEGVLQKCAAYAAREHGDARRALDLLRISGELAEREGGDKIQTRHVDMANEKIDRDKIIDVIEAAPKQFQLVLLGVMNIHDTKKGDRIFTGEVYEVYSELCQKYRIEVLTQRRVSDILAEMDMLGLINAKLVSHGRHGRTRDIRLSIPNKIWNRVKEIILNNL